MNTLRWELTACCCFSVGFIEPVWLCLCVTSLHDYRGLPNVCVLRPVTPAVLCITLVSFTSQRAYKEVNHAERKESVYVCTTLLSFRSLKGDCCPEGEEWRWLCFIWNHIFFILIEFENTDMYGFNLASSFVFGFAGLMLKMGPEGKNGGGRRAKWRAWSWSTLLLVHSYAHSSLQTTKLCSEQVALCYICWLNHKHSLFLCFTRNFLWPGVYRLQERCWACPVSNCSVLVIEWAGYNLQSQSKHPIPQTGQAASGSVFQETLQLWLSDL